MVIRMDGATVKIKKRLAIWEQKELTTENSNSTQDFFVKTVLSGILKKYLAFGIVCFVVTIAAATVV